MGWKIQGSPPLLEIIQKIKSSDLVDTFTIERLIDEETAKFLKASVIFKNGTLLYLKSFTSTDKRKYSYHWQTKTGRLIRRWDNAPHGGKKWRIIDHCHIGTSLVSTKPPTIDEVLDHVRNYKS